MSVPPCKCGCGQPVPPPKGRGRPSEYATPACRVRAYRRRQALSMELVAVDAAPAVQDLSPLASSTDEQIARALLEARGVAGTFLRIGREARPQFAWRAERLGGAIAAAIDDYFGGVFS